MREAGVYFAQSTHRAYTASETLGRVSRGTLWSASVKKGRIRRQGWDKRKKTTTLYYTHQHASSSGTTSWKVSKVQHECNSSSSYDIVHRIGIPRRVTLLEGNEETQRMMSSQPQQRTTQRVSSTKRIFTAVKRGNVQTEHSACAAPKHANTRVAFNHCTETQRAYSSTIIATVNSESTARTR